MARIRRFHRRGRGSIPRKGAWQIFTIIPPTGMLVQIRVPIETRLSWNRLWESFYDVFWPELTSGFDVCFFVENLFPPLRGIEPRPRRWKRRILATRPQGIWYRRCLTAFCSNMSFYWGSKGCKTGNYWNVLLTCLTSCLVKIEWKLFFSLAGNRTPAAAVRAPNPSPFDLANSYL